MSLDVTIIDNFCDHCGHGNEVFDINITHNLNKMATAAGIYEAMWRPHLLYTDKIIVDDNEENELEESITVIAGDLIPHLQKGIDSLELRPSEYKKLNPENGWGSYETLLRVSKELLTACTNYPNAKVEVDR